MKKPKQEPMSNQYKAGAAAGYAGGVFGVVVYYLGRWAYNLIRGKRGDQK